MFYVQLEYSLFEGVLNGNYKEWNKRGYLISEGNYKNGKKEGYWRDINKRNDGINDDDDWGKLIFEGNYKDGEKDGIWKIYHPNGTIEKKVKYQNGRYIKKIRN